MKKSCMLWLHALLALAAGAALAQSGSAPDPLDPRARVPAIDHRATLSTYQPYRDPGLANWRETNDQVGRLGGHVGHTSAGRGAGKPAPKPAKDAPATHEPAASGRGGRR